MQGPVSPDATLAHHVEGEGHMALFFKHQALSAEGSNKVVSGSQDLLWLGRSVLGQVGVDVQVNGQAVQHNGSGVFVPVQFEAYTTVGQTLLDDLHTLTAQTEAGTTVEWQGRELPIGRFADFSKLARQNPEEIQRDIEDSYISFDVSGDNHETDQNSFRVNDDGSVDVPLSPLEFILNTDHFLGSTEARLGLLHEGRAAVARDSDHIYKDPDEPLPDFLLGGIRLSAGPRFWRVLTHINDHLEQLPSAALFDANRLMGVGKHLPEYDRNRQVELRRIPEVTVDPAKSTYGNTTIPIEFYRSAQVGRVSHGATNWLRMSKEARRQRHNHGITALQALETADPANREALFDITRDPKISAAVLTRRGIQLVPETGSAKLNTRNTVDKLRKAAQGVPEELAHLEPLIEDLGMAGDRTATVVMEQIRLEDINRLVSGGDARAIVFERFREDGSETMTSEELSTLVELSRRGIGIAWAQDGDYREFHPSGLWVKPGVSQRLDKLEMSVAIFGARREEVAQRHKQGINRFLDGLVELFDEPEYLAVVHGNGSGIMELADEGARKRGMVSVGAGIDVERLGQSEVNKKADGRMNVVSSALLTRQHNLEIYSTIPVDTEGGHGTVVELANSICFRKLLLVLPTPVIVVNNSGMYNGYEQLLEAISAQGKSGETTPPRQWIQNLVQFVGDFDQALEVVKNFKADPASVWRAAGISKEHVRAAYETHRYQLEKIGMRLPPFLEHAVRDFLANTSS